MVWIGFDWPVMVSVGVQALRESTGIAALLGGQGFSGGFWGDFIYLHTTWCPWLKISGDSWPRCGRQCEEGCSEGSENECPCVWAPQLIVVAPGLLCEPPGQRPCLKWLVPYQPRNGRSVSCPFPGPREQQAWRGAAPCVFWRDRRRCMDRKGDGWLHEGVMHPKTCLASFPTSRLEFQLF